LDRPHRAAAILGGLAVCVLGGAACAWLGTPLPWMIGSTFAMAAARMAGAPVAAIPGGRNAGMLVVGVSLGLYFTPPVVREVLAPWPWFVGLGFAALAIGASSALLLMYVGGVDRPTAYFGSMPGGAADMVNVGERHGAQRDTLALSHSVRLLVLIGTIPAGITLAGFTATEDYIPVRIPLDPAGLAVLLGAATLAGFAAQRIGAPTAFTLGPLILAIALTVAGVQLSSVPPLLTNAAQVLLGASLGVHFDRSFLGRAPRLLAAVGCSVALTIGLGLAVGWLIAVTSGAYLGTALLAAAPGGIAEMSITAQVLRIGVAFVTAAHVIRYLIVVLLCIPVYHLLERIRAGAGR
jgi:membrane AbrB-like protein